MVAGTGHDTGPPTPRTDPEPPTGGHTHSQHILRVSLIPTLIDTTVILITGGQLSSSLLRHVVTTRVLHDHVSPRVPISDPSWAHYQMSAAAVHPQSQHNKPTNA